MSGPSESKYIVVMVTASSMDEAAGIARTLVEERLAACGNIIEKIRSVYRWQGKIEDEGETLLILKTRADWFDRLKARVVELHSYEVPEVIALDINDGYGPYLDWIESNTELK